ncbi:secretory lipase [Prauserella shujinwangii]|uniref:Secretory lipase n=1 Tax=Prauserella shujinwangii TaxID=1453103 RepID=A0A2T0M0W7_9PSEU|nr:lipase family protein [Prauserella shujinwangii]PRX50207.1 secretory lipase [Prauserella shujinwangii]
MVGRLMVPLLLLTALVATSAPTVAARTPAPTPPVPSADPFYTPPAALPGEPGALLRHRAVDVYAEPLRALPVPVRAWQLLYRSTSATGEPNAVSATLLVPRSPWPEEPRPLVSYAVGTHGLGDSCAPSYRLRTGTENEIALISQALFQGWAVVVTDYEGLGTPGRHTYATGQSEGRAVLDAARAATRVPGAGLRPDGRVGVFGYSQGGQAAAFAGELQPTYAPDVRLAGVAAGGVPADLTDVARFNDGGPFLGLVLGAAAGLATAYPDVPFAEILNERGRRTVARIEDACVAELGAAAPFARLADFVTVPDPLADPRWQARLRENRAGERRPGAPVYLYHGILDELIPYPVGSELRTRYCALGAAVRWRPVPLAGHITAVSAVGPAGMRWLGDRFAGKAVRSAC